MLLSPNLKRALTGIASALALVTAPLAAAQTTTSVPLPMPVAPVVAAPVPTATPLSTPVPPAPPVTAAALKLAALFVPRDLFLASNQKSFADGFSIMAQKNTDLQAMFTAFPGMKEVLIAKNSKAMDDLLTREYDGLIGIIAQFADARYTPADLVELDLFYRSDAGVKLITAEYNSLDTEAMINAFGNDKLLTVEEVKAASAKGSAQLGRDLTKAERLSAMRFFLTPAGQKVRKATPDMTALTVDWVNKLMAENGKIFETATIETITSFIEKSGKK